MLLETETAREDIVLFSFLEQNLSYKCKIQSYNSGIHTSYDGTKDILYKTNAGQLIHIYIKSDNFI